MMAQDLKLFFTPIFFRWLQKGRGSTVREDGGEKILTQPYASKTFINILHKFLEAHFALYRLLFRSQLLIYDEYYGWENYSEKSFDFNRQKKDKLCSPENTSGTHKVI